MHELRPDIDGDVEPTNHHQQVDDRVIAPTETLDDRTDDDPYFEMSEEISAAGTGYDPVDPAEGAL